MTTKELEQEVGIFDEWMDEQAEGADVEEGPKYPHLTWKFGDPDVRTNLEDALGDDVPEDKLNTMRYRGGWFLADDTISRFHIDTDALEDLGWVRDKFKTKNGDVEGYSAALIEARFVRARRRWVGRGENSTAYTWSEGFDARERGEQLRSHLQVLTLVKGLESVGPFTLTMKGSAQMAWYGAGYWRGDGVMDNVRSTLIASANRLTSKKTGSGFHYMTFNVPVGVKYVETGKGKAKKVAPRFIEMGRGDDTTMVVVPEVIWPDDIEPSNEMDAEVIKTFMQPRDSFRAAQELFKESEEWAAEWESEATVGDNDAPAEEDHDADTADDEPVAQAEAVVDEDVDL